MQYHQVSRQDQDEYDSDIVGHYYQDLAFLIPTHQLKHAVKQNMQVTHNIIYVLHDPTSFSFKYYRV